MLIVVRMLQAFVRAAAAHLRAGVEHQLHDRFIESRPTCNAAPPGRKTPYRQVTGCKAYVRAIQIHFDAVTQPVEPFFVKAGIGTGPARKCANEACIRSQNETITGQAVIAGAGIESGLNIHRFTPMIAALGCGHSRR